MNKSSLFILYTLLFINSSFADCLDYKITPSVQISVPEYKKEIVSSDDIKDKMHGNVAATFIEEFDLIAESAMHDNGACIVLKSVSAKIGYGEFLISIDASHRPGSCEYNAIIEHEDEHIQAYLSVIKDMAEEIKASVTYAADSIMPTLVAEGGRANAAMDDLHRKIQEHPDIVLLKQKIDAEVEIRNKRVDQNDKNDILIKKCR